MAEQSTRSKTTSPFVVALAAWMVPGLGYLLLKQYARGLTIGITVLMLFILGLLVGGIRALDVPGYNAQGNKLISSIGYETDRNGHRTQVYHIGKTVPGNLTEEGWVLLRHPLDEIRSKPWSIPQIMMGPLDVLCDWFSVSASQPLDADKPSLGPIGARSHARLNELGVLYTAVAGMLNLLAILDSSHRAGHTEAK